MSEVRALAFTESKLERLNKEDEAASRSWWKNRKGVFSRYPKTK